MENNIEITINMVEYIEAVRYVTEHNPMFDGEEEEARLRLDELIKECIRYRTTISSSGFHVGCYDFSDDDNFCCVDILVSPALGQESFFMTIKL